MALLGASIGPGTAAEPLALVMPVAYGTHLPGVGKPAAKFAKLVGDRSGGSLEIRIKEPGDGTQPHQILEKVSAGKVDAGFATASLWAAKIPAAPLFAGFPFGPDAKTYSAWFTEGGGRKLYQDMYDQSGFRVHVIPCAFGGAETSGWFAKEIGGVQDLAGLRMRIFGLGARVMEELGVKTVLVPGGSVGAAFDKKEIDAAELLPPAADAQAGPPEQTKLIYVPGWHQPETVLELLISKSRWTKLTPQQQTLIEGVCHDLLGETREENGRLQSDALASFEAKGVRAVTWPDELLKAFRGAWGRIAKEEGDHDLFFRVALTDLEEFRAKLEGVAADAARLAPVGPAPQTPPAVRQSPASTTR
jgi:TRAP-type mannitol/chloroaromatic compound transport system substrate-binding protein